MNGFLFTEWLSGLIVIAAAVMCVWLAPLVHSEYTIGVGPWWRNKALRISAGLMIHAVGAVVLFLLSKEAETQLSLEFPRRALLLLWLGLSLWLLGKTVMLSASKWFPLTMALYLVWSIAYLVRMF